MLPPPATPSFTERGAQVSLVDIAGAAGVTKGGLMYHFPTRDALIHAVYQHIIGRMWEEVRAHIDLSENRPGKFTRGYVRALTGDSQYLLGVFSPTGFIAALGSAIQDEEFNQRDAQAWNFVRLPPSWPTWPRSSARPHGREDRSGGDGSGAHPAHGCAEASPSAKSSVSTPRSAGRPSSRRHAARRSTSCGASSSATNTTCGSVTFRATEAKVR